MIKVQSTPHAEVMQSLADRHQLLLQLINDKPFHYLDIPVHGNIGDLLIMHGTQAFFRRHRLKPKLSAPAFAFNASWIAPDDVIVFHGGGNFGDLYSEYGMQPMREKIVSEYPDHRIIILPQTIHFSSPEALETSSALFRQHGDVHLCVRDVASYDLAKAFTDHVYLMPDMAHQLYPINHEIMADMNSRLLISRVDGEKKQALDPASFGAAAMTDWPELVGHRENTIDFYRRMMRYVYRAGAGFMGNQILSDHWSRYARKLTQQAVDLFARHELIVTDRLHGHILACLMDKPSIVLDNSYGKNAGYVDTWTRESDLVSLKAV